MSTPAAIGSLVAVERAATRDAVVKYARQLYASQHKLWQRNADQGLPNKPRPPTWAECIAKSRQLRIKRERNATYFNHLIH